MLRNYWIVGAAWGGVEDTLPAFITRGYWYCWDIPNSENESSSSGNSVPSQRLRFRQVKEGDRIAVKKVTSITTQKMEIRALGIAKAIDLEEWRIYVDQLPILLGPNEIKRGIELKGCTASIHGPFNNSDPWINQIFSI